MTPIEITLSVIVALMAIAGSYRGMFGTWPYRAIRVPLAFTGGVLIGIATAGCVPPFPQRQEQYEDETEQVREVEVPNDPGKEDDKYARFLWSLKGLTPMDIRDQNVSQSQGNHAPDPEWDDVSFANNPRESISDFQARRQMERDLQRAG